MNIVGAGLDAYERASMLASLAALLSSGELPSGTLTLGALSLNVYFAPASRPALDGVSHVQVYTLAAESSTIVRGSRVILDGVYYGVGQVTQDALGMLTILELERNG